MTILRVNVRHEKLRYVFRFEFVHSEVTDTRRRWRDPVSPLTLGAKKSEPRLRYVLLRNKVTCSFSNSRSFMRDDAHSPSCLDDGISAIRRPCKANGSLRQQETFRDKVGKTHKLGKGGGLKLCLSYSRQRRTLTLDDNLKLKFINNHSGFTIILVIGKGEVINLY